MFNRISNMTLNTNTPLTYEHALLGLMLVSAFAIAQTDQHFDPQPNIDQRVTGEILDSAGEWRQAPAQENEWRASKDETVQNRRFHFGSDSAYEEMRYQNSDQFRTMGTSYEDVRPSSLFKYNF